MKQRKQRVWLSLGARITLICYLLVLLPASLFSVWLSNDWRDKAIQDRSAEIQGNLYLISGSVSQTSNLCNLSTQVFLNTRSLTDYLQNLSDGVSMKPEDVLHFFRNDISSLEKMVVGNPYLYMIRVYSVAENITEMWPILFGADRMHNMPWGDQAPLSGTWCLDYPDKLYADKSDQHIMSLLTNIKGKSGERIGVLEVGVPMDQLMPALFQDTQALSDFLVLDNGQYFGSSEAKERLLPQMDGEEIGSEPVVRELTDGGNPVLVGAIHLEAIGGTYYLVESFERLNGIIQSRQIYLLLALGTTAIVLFFIVNGVIKNILRQFYQVLDGVKKFSEGDLDTTIQCQTQDEVGIFAGQVNSLLDNIRELMRTNMEREMLIKNTEIKALQNQINAHFIYNVLEAIKMMAEIEGNYLVSDAVTNLGKLLRYSMRWNCKEVTLQEEVDYINNYLSLMNLRFDYEIKLKLEVPPELMHIMVPKISLQPIVENAVIHGCVGLNRDCQITLCVRREGEICYIDISDDGNGLDEVQLEKVKKQLAGLEPVNMTKSNGIGLKNVQDRIRMLFGDSFGIIIRSEQNHGTTVGITVPYVEIGSGIKP